jgi:hypothetical protein
MAAKLDFELEGIMTTPDTVAAARLVICEHAPDDAALFLNMLGIGPTPAWNMGVQA